MNCARRACGLAAPCAADRADSQRGWQRSHPHDRAQRAERPTGGVWHARERALDLNRDHMKLESPEARSSRRSATTIRNSPSICTPPTARIAQLNLLPPLHPNAAPTSTGCGTGCRRSRRRSRRRMGGINNTATSKVASHVTARRRGRRRGWRGRRCHCGCGRSERTPPEPPQERGWVHARSSAALQQQLHRPAQSPRDSQRSVFRLLFRRPRRRHAPLRDEISTTRRRTPPRSASAPPTSTKQSLVGETLALRAKLQRRRWSTSSWAR